MKKSEAIKAAIQSVIDEDRYTSETKFAICKHLYSMYDLAVYEERNQIKSSICNSIEGEMKDESV